LNRGGLWADCSPLDGDAAAAELAGVGLWGAGVCGARVVSWPGAASWNGKAPRR